MLAAIHQALLAFATFLAAYGYYGLFGVSFIAAFAIPIPSSAILALSGALAAKGDMNIYGVLTVALLGNVSADLIAFSLARRYGVTTLRRIGFGRVLDSSIFTKLDAYVSAHAPSILYVTRLVTEAGPAVNILSGLGTVRARTFLLYDALGELSFVLLFGLSGYFLGAAWENNTYFLFKGVLVLVSLGLLGGIAQYVLRARTTATNSVS